MITKHTPLKVITALVLLLNFQLTFAAIPSTLNYQGHLTDSGGAPVDGPVTMVFAIYDVDSGGIAQWSDTVTVPVNQGIFSVELGSSASPLPVGLFETPLWIGLSVVPDTEMMPRRPITSTAYSFRASDADTVEGISAVTLDQSAHVTDTINPHNVTAVQVGAASAGVITTEIGTHAADASAHHDKTSSFAELSDQATDSQIPVLIARDSEITWDNLAGKPAGFLDNTDNDTLASLGCTDTQIAKYKSGTGWICVNDQAIELLNIIKALDARVDYLEMLLAGVSRTSNNISFSGVNVQVDNGTGTTTGTPNGLGNLTVGYNELRGAGDIRTGSHNIVAGAQQNYSSYGGIVSGLNNTIASLYASVIGGQSNTANGPYAVVTGGQSNVASGNIATVSGGYVNGAGGLASSVNGGNHNSATGIYSTVGGGAYNTASGESSSVSGGGGALAVDGNLAVANYSAILGGKNNLSGDGNCAWDASAGRNVCTAGTVHTLGQQATVSGGLGNTANGEYATVTSGTRNSASGLGSAVTGGAINNATHEYANVSGGQQNIAGAPYAHVIGGLNYVATTQNDVLGIQNGSITSAMIADGTIVNSDISTTGGIYSSKDAVYENINSGTVNGYGTCITLMASCNDSNDLPVSGHCEPPSATDADLQSTRNINWDNSLAIAQYQCTVCNTGTLQRSVDVGISCIAAP